MVAIVAQPPVVSKAKRKRGEAAVEAEIDVEELFRIVRGAAPFAGLSRRAFEGVLDLLAGLYPSDEFAELRPRVTWDRVRNVVTPRQGAKLLAIINGGTIPDRGLYGVFLSGSETKAIRVGELDEEMVFESRTGDTFILEPRRGGLMRSLTIGCWFLPRRGSRARCLSGTAIRRGVRSNLGAGLAHWCGRFESCRTMRRSAG